MHLKISGLKFINSLCKEKNFLQKYVDLKGKELLENILNFELILDGKEGLLNDYSVIDFYCFKKSFETQTNPIIIETLRIVNKITKNNYDFLDNNMLLFKVLGIIR